MSYQKPLVTIELDEYNKMLKMMDALNESMDEIPYKKALEEIIFGLKRGELKIDYNNPSNNFLVFIFGIFKKNKPIVDSYTFKITIDRD